MIKRDCGLSRQRRAVQVILIDTDSGTRVCDFIAWEKIARCTPDAVWLIELRYHKLEEKLNTILGR